MIMILFALIQVLWLDYYTTDDNVINFTASRSISKCLSSLLPARISDVHTLPDACLTK
jgi:hypothetical protein